MRGLPAPPGAAVTHPCARRDDGAASGLVLALVAVAVTVLLSVAWASAALSARARAAAAADAAALAGALARQDGGDACAAARQAAAANRATVLACLVDPAGVTVAVSVAPRGLPAAAGPAVARSRAGPAPPGATVSAR